MTKTEAIKAQIAKLTLADIQAYQATQDKLLWVEYNILDLATPEGISNAWAERAEGILDRTIAATLKAAA